MNTHKESFRRVVLLTAARVFGVVFSIVIPMYLGRKLSIESYGTYKQLMLFFWFSQVALNLGFDDSAFYFFRWEPSKLPLYSFNALFFNLFVTGTLWIVLTIYKVEIAGLIGNPDIAQYLSLLGFLILATVSSMQIEGILIVGLNRFNDRLWVEMGTELLKALAIIGAFYFFDSVYVALLLLSLIMSIRLIATVAIIHRCKIKEKLSYRESVKYIVKQFKFGIPLGVSRILQNILNMENFFISHFFSLIQFTYYTVGCFENPLVNAVRMSMFELANIELVDAMRCADYDRAVEVWRSMSRKLFLFIVPFIFYMIFFSNEIITFIFSSKYLLSVPYFMLFNVYLFVGALNPEPLFRATSRTRLALLIKILGLTSGVFLLVAGAYVGGPLYALGGKVLGVLIMNIIGLFIGARLLKTSFVKLFQWSELVNVTILSIVLSLSVRIVFWQLTWSLFNVLAVSFSLYVFLHFVLSWKFNLIKEDEILYLKNKSYDLFIRSKLILKMS